MSRAGGEVGPDRQLGASAEPGRAGIRCAGTAWNPIMSKSSERSVSGPRRCSRRSARTLLAGAAITASLLCVSAAGAQPLPTDERIVQGTLPNGLKYMVLKHQNPPGRATMWINVSSGSLNETDEQRGLAHYLEHMAFNGSENFPPGTVIDFFQSMGLNFGQHQNAFTSFDQTVYQLAFPDTKPETLDKGMTFFADVAGRLLLLPKEIDEERQIILEEKRARSGGPQRIQDYILERVAPGSLIGQRIPIGTDESLKTVQEKNFRDYYSKYYVPSNMTIMVVADEDPSVVVDHIKKNFSFGERVPVPADQDPRVAPTDKTFAIVATDKEVTEASISINRIDKPRPPVTTYEQMRTNLVTDLATAAFNRRMGAKINKGGTAYLSASASSDDLFHAGRWNGVSASGKPEEWKNLVNELGHDLQQARQHGFTQRELDDVKKDIIAGAERFVEQEKTVPAAMLMRRMNNSVNDGEPVMSAVQELDALKKILPTITPSEVSSEFATVFDPTNVVFIAELPSSLADVPSEQQLVDLGKKALDVKTQPMADEDRPTQLLAKAPAPGSIVEQSEHAASQVATAVLSNNVIVHHRFMDIRKDQVQVSINLAGGTIQETAKDRGIAEVASLAWSRPATSKLTSTNIRDLLTGKNVRVGGFSETDTLSLSISGSPKDLETGFQLAYLLLTDPKIEDGAFEQWKKATLQQIEERTKNPQAAFGELLATTIYPVSDARTQSITAAQVEARTPAEAQAWLAREIASAPIEVTIVGDIQRDEAMRLASTYLGSLSNRPKMTGSTLDELRKLQRPVGPIAKNQTIDTPTPVALACCGFYGPDFENLAETRTMQAASRIMSTRMIQRVREKEQLAYSPGAGLRPNAEYPGFSMFMAIMPTDPSKVERVLTVVPEMFAEFAKDGPTEEEMTTMKKQMANTLDESMKQPNFWVGNTGTITYRSRTLDDVMAANEFYQNLTAEQIKTVFAKYYTPANSVQMSLTPSAASAAPASAPAGQGEKSGG